MKLDHHHLTYCTNIHSGEHWADVWTDLQTYLLPVRQALSPHQPFGIGLRLSNIASQEILANNQLSHFKRWLTDNNYYVFTLNGFPYGNFHHQVIKDAVHQPDWTTPERLAYTLRLFDILAELLPNGMEGGISTSPLSYKLWYDQPQALEQTLSRATQALAQVAAHLYQIQQTTGKLLHLDIEPEPDGLLETTQEVIDYFHQWLLPRGSSYLQQQLALSPDEAERCLRSHIQVCYDVCHFAVEYEQPQEVLTRWQRAGIQVGKIQISAALKSTFPEPAARQPVVAQFRSLVESTYLHQVVARTSDGRLVQYNDLPQALDHAYQPDIQEWRTHFHVPIFVSHYGTLAATQSDIEEVLAIVKKENITRHLEVETYTWEVLPPDLQLGLTDSIIRELQWVQATYNA